VCIIQVLWSLLGECNNLRYPGELSSNRLLAGNSYSGYASRYLILHGKLRSKRRNRQHERLRYPDRNYAYGARLYPPSRPDTFFRYLLGRSPDFERHVPFRESMFRLRQLHEDNAYVQYAPVICDVLLSIAVKGRMEAVALCRQSHINIRENECSAVTPPIIALGLLGDLGFDHAGAMKAFRRQP
jgi:hypothetical protein